MPQDNKPRIFWGEEPAVLPKLDLIAMFRASYADFLEKGIAKTIKEICPVTDFTRKNYELEFGEHYFEKSKRTPHESIEQGLNYDAPLKIKAKLTNLETGKVVTQDVFLGDIPQMTEVGTFIINGIERVVISQIVRSPGIYFVSNVDAVSGKTLYEGELRPVHGCWLEFGLSRGGIYTIKIDRRRKFPATILLRALEYSSDEELLQNFPFLEKTISKDYIRSTSEALLDLYTKMRPGEPAVLDNAREYFRNLFFNPRRYSLGSVGRYKLNRKLGLNTENKPENWILLKDDIVAAINYLANLSNGKGETDDIDHLSNRRIRLVGELVETMAFRPGILRLERTLKEKMSLAPTDMPIQPSFLVNARPIMASINEFFRSSQLSAILDQTNLLSEVDNIRRLTVMGTGGISRERASFSVRDINSSQYGRICPVRSPEGPNIGLVTYMTLYTRVNEYGFLETPYRKVINDKGRMKITDEVVYLDPDKERDYYITHCQIKIDKNGYIMEDRVAARYKGDYLETEKESVSYIDISPRQVFGTSAVLLPFIDHDDAIRADMGTNMQCQAVPLVNPYPPLIGTGMETVVAEAMNRSVRSKNDGVITYVDGEKVIVNKKEVYKIEKFKRTAQSTCYSQNPVVQIGQKVKAGDLLIDAPSCRDGELSLGQNLLIGYMAYEGLGYEDAIVISDEVVKSDKLTSIHIEEYEAALVDTKLGPEEITRDIPNVNEMSLANLDAEGIVVPGSDVKPNDILVGKIAPKGETELSAEERLLRAIFGEKAREVRDTSLRMPHGEKGTVISVQILDKDKGAELDPGTNKLIKVQVAQVRKVVVGDKLAGRHGNKGVISKIMPVADMPHLLDGTPIDIIMSPFSVLARMNLGLLLEAHLGLAAKINGDKFAIPVFEKISEEKIIAEMKRAQMPLSGKMELIDGRTGEPFQEEIVVGIAYILKLNHMVEDKTHARSTGPYSLVTQQPLGGKAQMGGQRLGEMEVWALEAHRAAHTLQEMLTIKSDDVVGRAKAFEAIVKGLDIPSSTVPEGFKVLVKELNSLCLDIIPVGVVSANQIFNDDKTNPTNTTDDTVTQISTNNALIKKEKDEQSK